MSTTRFQGLDAVELRAPGGARAVVTLHGAHVVSWVPTGGQEQLYLSPRSVFATGQPIRGGVPIIFPQFSNRGPMAKHGFARNLPWRLISQEQTTASFVLDDDAVTQAAWPHGFSLHYKVCVDDERLELIWTCRNTGTESFTFTAALHTYLRVEDIARVQVSGLHGVPWLDAVDGQHKPASDAPLRLDGEVDRVYVNVPAALHLQEFNRDGAPQRSVELRQHGFRDVVVWNPGAAKAALLADMPPEDHRHMLCIESAQVETPVRLEPGQRWGACQILRCVPP